MKRILFLASALVIGLSSLSARAAAEKEWTFLLYLNGNNSLDSFGPVNLEQMEKVGSSDQVNMVVEWASLSANTTKRLLIQKSSDPSNVTSPVLADIGQQDMGDFNTLEAFLKWGIQNYPAKHYFVDVWDHGSGWHSVSMLKMLKAKGMHPNDISFDDNTGHSITTKQLGQVMQDISAMIGQKIDIYGSDACLEGMIEVAGDMKDAVSYFVGSQDTEPGAGWPYTDFLAPLVATPTMSAHDLSALLAQTYTASYSGGSNGSDNATMSAVDMTKFSALQDAVTALGTEIQKMPAAELTQVNAAAGAAQSFESSDYVDLGDFATRVGALGLRDLDNKVVDNVKSALSDYVIVSKATTNYTGAQGVSIWIPKDTDTMSTYLPIYQALEFDGASHWDQALAAFVGK